MFDGIGIQDSVSFVMKAEKKVTLAGVTIVPDADVFPTPQTHFINISINQRVALHEYSDQSRLQFFSDGGIRNIHFDEITISYFHILESIIVVT